VHEDFVAEYEFSVDKAVFYPDVIATLTALKADNHKLGLCTNKPELPARAVIRHMGIESFFDAVMAAGMLNSRKPDPAMLLKTIEDLGGGPTLYVGDSEVDAETASRAGVRLALFSEGYRKTPVSEIQHDWVFSEFASLPAIVAKAMLIGPR
jgi:phosphoglycolate phosphatase